MTYLLLGAAALVYFVWLGRGGGKGVSPRRLMWTVASVAAAGAAMFVGLRGQWLISLGLVLLSLFLSGRGGTPIRGRRTYVPRTPPPPSSGMSVQEARDILGVAPGATRAEIEASFRRLMLRAHPDHGGTTGLAARINAARDRLLG